MRYKVPGPEYPEEYPEFPDEIPEYLDISGSQSGSSGFLWLQNLKSELGSISDSIRNGTS